MDEGLTRVSRAARRRFAARVAIWVAATALAVPVPSPSAPADRAADLAAMRSEIVRIERHLERLRVESGDIGANLNRMGVELSLQQARLSEAAAARAAAEAGAAQAAREIEQLTERVSAQRAALKRSLATLYRSGRSLPLRAVLSLEPGKDTLGAIRSLRYLARRDHRAVVTYRDTMEKLANERQVLAERREEADRWVARESDRQRELVAVKNRQERILASHRTETQRLTGVAGDLAERESRLATLLALVGESGAPGSGSGGAGGLEGRSARDFRGALDWPVAGRVTAEFGPRMDPRYKTRVPHRGLDLAPEAGSDVRAVYGGRVLYAGAFEDLGNLVVVRHPGGVTTLTSGLETLRVAKDDVLGFESVLGRSGETLYFEIRVDQKPEDPRQWLRPQLSRPLPPGS